jgi:phage shock protein C
MHCTHCGKEILPNTRFCPSCGTPVSHAANYGSVPPPSSGARLRPELLRPRSGRMVAGVCAAFARTYGWNANLIRILLVVLTPLHLGLGLIAYLIAWIIIPEEPRLLSPGGF